MDFGLFRWLIVVEGTQTPAGDARQARPRRHVVSRRLGGRPKVREVPGTKINNIVERSLI